MIHTTNEAPPRLSDVLMNLIVVLLAPMFLSVSGGDVRLAQMAAIETLNAYRVRDNADVIAVAQIIAFGLAALTSLSLSMADDISVAMTLRLHGNANALNRSAQHHRRALNQNRQDTDNQDPAEPHQPVPQPQAPPAPAQPASPRTPTPRPVAVGRPRMPEPPAAPPLPATNTPEIDDKQAKALWAMAMVRQAGEINATMANLPPLERQAASIRAAALSSTASNLLTYANPPPAPPPHRG